MTKPHTITEETTKNDSIADIIQKEALKVHKVLCGFEELLHKTSPHPFFEFNTPIGVWEFHKENRHEALHRQREELMKSFRDEVIGKDVRHITDTKGVHDIYNENEGNITYDEIISGVQAEIDAQNRFRAEQRQKLDKLK